MNTQDAIERLDRYIRVRYPIIAVVSHEESRVMASIRQIAEARSRDVIVWTVTHGMVGPNLQEDPSTTRDPIAAFEVILNFPDQPDPKYPQLKPTIFVLQDLHGYIDDPINTRYLRDIAARFELSRHTLVLLSPRLAIPTDLEKTVAVLDWPLPDEDELAAILRQCERDLPDHIEITLNGNRQAVIQAMRGLTEFEAASCLISAVTATGSLGEDIIPHIVSEKRQIIRKSGLLEFYEADVTMAQVGGLPYLKEYASVKRATFGEAARAAGVEPAKGVLLVGIPGTGKSLSAKAIAGGQLPLLRMDIGALFAGLVGQSEANMRGALKVAEAVAPCVLWVDEIEKALGSSGGEMDGGTSARVFGTLLTWMQESQSQVYVVATANDVRAIKPELLRRFDDLVFVDLPNHAGRVDILKIHLSRRRQDPARFDLDAVADAVWSFTGAEIEKVVKSALEQAFVGSQTLDTDLLLDASTRIIPIAATMKASIDDLRSWSNGRAIPAGDPLEPKQQKPVVVNRSRFMEP